MTEIHLHIDARMADYIRTHPYSNERQEGSAAGFAEHNLQNNTPWFPYDF